MKLGRYGGLVAAGLLALVTAPAAMQAQTTVTMYGALSNFDVINLTGQETHGFEIEIHGVNSIGGAFNWNRYGAPQVVPIPGGGGVYVRYLSPWDSASQKFLDTTPVAVHPTATNGHQCVLGTYGYDTSGCEHFGVWTMTNPSQTIYRWLVADPNNPGQLIAGADSLVAIPAPIWTVQPALPAEPVVIVAAVDPPIPPPPAKLFGAAQWMKTYKTENARQVGLDELVADNAVVPQDAAKIETAWDLIQSELGSNSKRKQKRGSLGNGSHAVVRRFEFFQFTGTIDPVTGEAICADGLCNAPADGEVSDFIGAQNAAANLNVPAQYNVTVAVAGDGSVGTADRLIDCPKVTCTTAVNADGQISLTATNGKGIFTGWTGACQGVNPICTIRVDSEAPVTATFTLPLRLTVRLTGLGTVTTNPNSRDFLPGTSVTMTATPAAGYVLSSWGTSCAGTASTCTITVNAATTVSVTFALIGAPAPPPAGTSYKLVMKNNGKGTVSSNPIGSSFSKGTAVTVTAVPDPTATWTGWTGGGCSGLALTCTVTMNADTTVQANFR